MSHLDPDLWRPRLLAAVPLGVELLGADISPDGARAAISVRGMNGDRVIVDGTVHEWFDEIPGEPAFVCDGRAVAYTARRGDRWFVVLDGIALGEGFDEVEFPEFGPGGAYAFAARRGEKWFVAGAGWCGEAYDELGEVAVDGAGRPIYSGRQGPSWFAVRGTDKSAPFDEISSVREHNGRFMFDCRRRDDWLWVVEGRTIEERSADRKVMGPDHSWVTYPGPLVPAVPPAVAALAGGDVDGVRSVDYDAALQPTGCVVRTAGNTFVAARAGRGPDFDDILDLEFLAEGVPLYAARKGMQWTVVVGHVPVAWFDQVWRTFADDAGKRWGAIVRQGTKWGVATGEGVGQWFDAVHKAGFVPSGGILCYEGREASRRCLVADGRRGPAFDAIGERTFSPDGRTVAYAARRDVANGVRWKAVFEDHVGDEWDVISDLTVSPDGASLAYLAWRGDSGHLVVNGETSRGYGDLWPPRFDPGGRRVAFGARLGRDLCWEVVTVRPFT